MHTPGNPKPAARMSALELGHPGRAGRDSIADAVLLPPLVEIVITLLAVVDIDVKVDDAGAKLHAMFTGNMVQL